MTRAAVALLAVATFGCAGARTNIRADDAAFPISLTHEIRASDGHLLGKEERVRVGTFATQRMVFGTFYEAIPLNPTTDISDEINRQVNAAGGQGVTDLTVATAACTSDYFVIFHLLPFWPGCSTVSITGTIVRQSASAAERAVAPAPSIAISEPRKTTTLGVQDADTPKARAQASLREGNTLLRQGRAAEALAKFTEAYRLFPSPKIHYNIGQAEGLIPGHEARGYQALSRFLVEAQDANPELRRAAEAERQKLRAKVGVVSVTGEPENADLWIDGVNAGKTSGDAPVILGIGAHSLRLKRDAALSEEKTLTIAGGETLDVRLRLAAAEAPIASVAQATPVAVQTPPAPTPVPPAPTPTISSAPVPITAQGIEARPDRSGRGSSALKKTGLVVGGVGILGVAVGLGFGADALLKKHDYESEPGCQLDCPDLQAAHTAGNLSTGFVIGGAVLVAAGATIYLLDRRDHQETTALQFGVARVADVWQMGLGGSF